MNTAEMPHNGEILKTYFAQKRIRKAALARLMHIQPSQLLQYTKRASIPAQVLWDISLHLQYNFFNEIALHLPPDYAQAPSEQVKQMTQTIQTLQTEITRLQTENTLMRSILQKE